MPGMGLIQYDIPPELHHRCKVAALNQGITLKAFLIAALETAADNSKRKG